MLEDKVGHREKDVMKEGSLALLNKRRKTQETNTALIPEERARDSKQGGDHASKYKAQKVGEVSV